MTLCRCLQADRFERYAGPQPATGHPATRVCGRVAVLCSLGVTNWLTSLSRVRSDYCGEGKEYIYNIKL